VLWCLPMVRFLGLLVGLVVLVLIAGFAYWAYQGYSIAKSVSVKDYMVTGVDVKAYDVVTYLRYA
jgi:hypothetical protein